MTIWSLGPLDVRQHFVSSLVRFSQTFTAATLSSGEVYPTLGTWPLEQMEEMHLYYPFGVVRFWFCYPSFCLFKNKHTIIESMQSGDYIYSYRHSRRKQSRVSSLSWRSLFKFHKLLLLFWPSLSSSFSFSLNINCQFSALTHVWALLCFNTAVQPIFSSRQV